MLKKICIAAFLTLNLAGCWNNTNTETVVEDVTEQVEATEAETTTEEAAAEEQTEEAKKEETQEVADVPE